MSGRRAGKGVDAGIQYKAPRWSAYLAYSYTDATYQSGFVEAAGSNPAADANGNITINPGDRLPGVPAHQGKLGLTWRVTDQWTVGAVLIAQSGQYLFGDEANLTPQLPGFVTLNLSTSYQLTPHIQFFALGRERHRCEILHLRHVLADHVGVSGAGAECDQSARLQPRGADWRVWRGADHVLSAAGRPH